MYDCERDFMDNTKIYDSDEIQTEYVAQIIEEVSEILKDRGYDPVNQIVGFLMSGDPGYISSYKEARSKISSIDRAKILEMLVENFVNKK